MSSQLEVKNVSEPVGVPPSSVAAGGMPRHLGVSGVMELLQQLGSAVRELVGKEDKLTHEFRTRSAAETQRHETALEELETQLSASVTQADAGFNTTKERLQALYAWRKDRIARAHKSSHKQRLAEVEDREGRRKYELQRGLMQRDNTRKTDLATATATLEAFRGRLAESQAALDGLEALADQSFRGYGKFRRRLAEPDDTSPLDLTPEENRLDEELCALLHKTQDDLGGFRKRFLPLVFRCLSIWLLLVGLALGSVGLVPLLARYGHPEFSYPHAGGVFAGLVILFVFLHQLGQRQSDAAARAITQALHKGRRMHAACQEKSVTRHTQELARIEQEYKDTTQRIEHNWDLAKLEAQEELVAWPRWVDEKHAHASERNEQLHLGRYAALEANWQQNVARIRGDAEAQKSRLLAQHRERMGRFEQDHAVRWQAIETEWNQRLTPIYQAIAAHQAPADARFPAWSAAYCDHWTPLEQFEHAARFARVEVDVAQLAEVALVNRRLVLPGPARFSLPLLLTYPDAGSILFETARSGREEVVQALNNLILRVLSVAPPGRIHFTVFDPVGLGQNFAGVMHLADYEESLINSRIWTQANQLEERLANLSEHMEKVIQMYLRNEYATIVEYNKQAGNIAEKYHVLVVADFPANVSEIAAKRLLNIASSGAKCGVYTFIHWDRRQPLPQDFALEDLKQSSVCLTSRGNDFGLSGQLLPGVSVVLDVPPNPEVATGFIHKIGQASKDSNRVEVPFSHVAPPDAEMWTGDTTRELTVPIGRTGATKLQYLAIGKGTCQHALIAGKTGSGKSTLFHVMITNLAMWCSPEMVEFYLVDFKKGVEFKCYAAQRLPHARVVAIESDREFGLSVLQRLDDELRRRGDLFRKLGVQDIAGYKRVGGIEPIPRSLLLIDEFQEFFVEDDKIAQTASVLLDRIVRQGRAFGIHVLLGSQTLGGAYTLARTTLGQMVIRIALQCNEADAYLIMDENNPAPRLLSRPGEGIYNDSAGMMEGNSPFQVVWLPDQVRDSYLEKVRTRADQTAGAYPGPIVFEGNAPSDVRENPLLRDLLDATSVTAPAAARFWLGAPNSIKGPTEAIFHRQSGNNLLLVGQRDEATLAIFSVALIALAAQHPRGAIRIVVFDGNPPDSSPRLFLEKIVQAIPHDITLAKYSEVGDIMNGLAADLKTGSDEEHASTGPATFVFIHALQKFKKLHYEEDFSFSSGDGDSAPAPGAILQRIITEGPKAGFHVIASCDSGNNVNRCLGRKALSEFEMRVLFQMSANDSATLIDSPKASTLGLHRALFYNEQEGYLETFRPYALPAGEWIEHAGQQLAQRTP